MSEATQFEVVRFYDPEVVAHNEASTCGRYSIERDLSLLDIPPDAKPIRFFCKALSRDQRNACGELQSERRRYDLAFRYGVNEIHNLPDANGNIRQPWVQNRRKAHAALDYAWIDATGLGDADIMEIGSAIWGLSFLALGAPPRCVQLDSSLLVFGAVERRLAELKQG